MLVKQGNQAVAIGIVIHAMEICVNFSFARFIIKLCRDFLPDPLRDCDRLDCALMASLDLPENMFMF